MKALIMSCALLGMCALLPRSLAAQEGSLQPGEPEATAPTRLSLREAVRLAVQSNPEVRAAVHAAEARRGAWKQAGIYPFNPELDIDAPGSVESRQLGEYEISLTQRIEYAGQTGLRSAAGEQEWLAAAARSGDAARMAIQRTTEAYYSALAAQRRLGVAREVVDLSQRLLEATRTQLDEGEISVLEANIAEIEQGRARARQAEVESEVETALTRLRAELGMAQDREIQLVSTVPEAPESLDPEALVELAIARRSDLGALRAERTAAEQRRRLAVREALPELTVGIIADREAHAVLDRTAGALSLRENLPTEPEFGVAASLSLPLWNRQQGHRAETRAEVRASEARLAAQEAAVRAEVRSAVARYRSATEQVALFEQEVLQPARQNQSLLQTAYGAGKIDLPTVVVLRNQLFDAELEYWDAWLAQRHALAALEAATASSRALDDLTTEGDDR